MIATIYITGAVVSFFFWLAFMVRDECKKDAGISFLTAELCVLAAIVAAVSWPFLTPVVGLSALIQLICGKQKPKVPGDVRIKI